MTTTKSKPVIVDLNGRGTLINDALGWCRMDLRTDTVDSIRRELRQSDVAVIVGMRTWCEVLHNRDAPEPFEEKKVGRCRCIYVPREESRSWWYEEIRGARDRVYSLMEDLKS